MGFSGWISAAIVGLIIGYLGRFLAPRSRGAGLGILLTMLIGVVAALAGTAIAQALHTHLFVAVFALQLVCSAVFVSGFARLTRR